MIIFINASYPGLALQALFVTLALILTMLVVYVAFPHFVDKVNNVIGIAIGAVLIINLIFFALYMFGIVSYFSTFNLVLTAFIVGIATLSLLSDFRNVNVIVDTKQSKDAEYVAAFGLMITII